MQHGLVPLEGGFSGETFLAEVAGERSVVRVYAGRSASRGDRAVEVDAAVLRLVRGLLPVPEVLEVRLPDPADGVPAVLVTGFLPGTRLDLLLPGLDDEGLRRAGESVGAVAARLAQMPLVRPGLFVDRDLRTEPFPGDDLPGFVRSRREGTALAGWSPAAFDALLEVADRAEDLRDQTTRTCLVHGDLNPKNLLLDPDTLAVTGVLDWEFAHAGSPYTDLGNLLRFDRQPAWLDAVLATYAGRVPDAPADLLDRARAADLVALVDLAARRDENAVACRAHDLLAAAVATGDPHAWPGAPDGGPPRGSALDSGAAPRVS